MEPCQYIVMPSVNCSLFPMDLNSTFYLDKKTLRGLNRTAATTVWLILLMLTCLSAKYRIQDISSFQSTVEWWEVWNNQQNYYT